MNVAEVEVIVKANVKPMQKGLADAKADVHEFKADTEKQVAALKANAEKSAKAAGASVAELRRSVVASATGVGQSLTTALTVPLIGAGVAVAKASVEFDQSLRNVDSIAKLTASQFDHLRTSVLALTEDSNIRQGPADLAAGLYDVYSSGFKGSEAMDILKVAAYGASAGMSDTTTAGKALMAVLNSGVGGVKSAQEAMDVLFKEVDLGVNSFSDLASQIGDVLPTAATAKVSLQEVAAAMAVMTRNGISAAESSTSINTLLLHIIKPGKDAIKVMDELGVSYGLNALASKGLSGWLADLEQKTHGSKQAMVEMVPEVRALRGLLSLTKDSGKDYNDMLAQMGHASDGVGSTMAALTRQNAGAGAQWEITTKELKVAAVMMGDTLAPEVKLVTKSVRDLAEDLRKMTPEQREAIVTTGKWVAILGPVIWGFGKVAGGIQSVIALRSAYVAAVGAQTAANLALANSATAAGDAEAGLAAKAGILATATRALAGAGVVLAGVAGSIAIVKGLGDDFAKGAREATAQNSVTMAEMNNAGRAKAMASLKDYAKAMGGDYAKAYSAVAKDMRASWGFSTQDLDAAIDQMAREGMERGRKATAALLRDPVAVAASGSGIDNWKMPGKAKKVKESADAREARQDAEDMRDKVYDLNKALALNGNALESAALRYDILHGKYEGASLALAQQSLTLTLAGEAQDKHREKVKAATAAQKAWTDEVQTHAAKALIASGGLNDQDRMALDMFSKRFGALTDEHNKQRVLMALEEEKATKAKVAADAGKQWVKQTLDGLNAEIDKTKDLTRVQQVQRDLADRAKAGTPVDAATSKGLLDAASKVDEAESVKKGVSLWREYVAIITEAGKKQKALRDEQEKAAGDRYADVMLGLSDRIKLTGSSAEVARFKLDRMAESFGWGNTQAQRMATGMTRAKQAMLETLKTERIEAFQARMTDLANTVGESFGHVASDMLKDFKISFHSIIASFSEMLADMARQWAEAQVKQAIQNWLIGMAAGAAGGKGGGSTGAGGANGPGIGSGGGQSALAGTNGPVLHPASISGMGDATTTDGASQSMAQRKGKSVPTGGHQIHITMHINTPDAGSFRQSGGQMANDLGHRIRMAVGKNS